MSGVTSLNTLTGVVGLTSGNPLIGVGTTANNVVVTALAAGITGITVQGQTPQDPLTSGQLVFVPGSNVTMATDSLANTLTITSTGGGGGVPTQIVSGGTSVVCDGTLVTTTAPARAVFNTGGNVDLVVPVGGSVGEGLRWQQSDSNANTINTQIRPQGAIASPSLNLFTASSAGGTTDAAIMGFAGAWDGTAQLNNYLSGTVVESPIDGGYYVATQTIYNDTIDPSADITGTWAKTGSPVSIGYAPNDVRVDSGGNITANANTSLILGSGGTADLTTSANARVTLTNLATSITMGLIGEQPVTGGLFVNDDYCFFNGTDLTATIQGNGASVTCDTNPSAPTGDINIVTGGGVGGNVQIDTVTGAPSGGNFYANTLGVIHFTPNNNPASYFRTTTLNGEIWVGGSSPTPPTSGLYVTSSNILFNNQNLLTPVVSELTNGLAPNVGTVSVAPSGIASITAPSVSVTTPTFSLSTSSGAAINVGVAPVGTGLYVGNNTLTFDGNNVLIPSQINGGGSVVSCDTNTGQINITPSASGNIVITSSNGQIQVSNSGSIQIQRNWTSGVASGTSIIEFGDDGRIVLSGSSGKLTVGGLTTEPVGLQIQSGILRFDNVQMNVP